VKAFLPHKGFLGPRVFRITSPFSHSRW
jgi:hypothetical protein